MDPTKRFSNRVDDYIKYRPSYPPEAIRFIIDQFHVNRQSSIADIGSGTGILTRLLSEYPKAIYAVEPNTEMRSAAEFLFKDCGPCVSVNGSAESTGLQDHSINLVTAAQAFHWFDPVKTKIEFKRILKPDGNIVLIWNTRKTDTPFLIEYEKLLKTYAVDYTEVDHRRITDKILKSFFIEGAFDKKTFDNVQKFDYRGLKGRLNSSSYCPLPGETNYLILESKLEELFNAFNHDGFIDFNYDTELYWGKL
jgi:SAM-dependent methyltransferase